MADNGQRSSVWPNIMLNIGVMSFATWVAFWQRPTPTGPGDHQRWWVLGVGAALSLATWGVGFVNSKNEEKRQAVYLKEKKDHDLRMESRLADARRQGEVAIELANRRHEEATAASNARHAEAMAASDRRTDVLIGHMKSFIGAGDDRRKFLTVTSAGRSNVSVNPPGFGVAVSLGSPDIGITPGTGELKVEGFAPTVTIESLNERVQREKAALLAAIQEHSVRQRSREQQIVEMYERQKAEETDSAIQASRRKIAPPPES